MLYSFKNADRPTLRYELLGIKLNQGQWRWNKERALLAVKNYQEYLEKHSRTISLYEYWLQTGKGKEFTKREPEATRCYYWISPKEEIGVDTSWLDVYAYDNSSDLDGNDIIKLTSVIRKIRQLFFLEVVNCSSGGGVKTGKNMGVCKETFYIHLLASEKSKFLSVNEFKNRISIN